jgi:membrane dipeptidase
MNPTIRTVILGTLSVVFLTVLCMSAEETLPADHFPIEPDLSCAAANDQPRSDYHVNLSAAQEKRALAVYRRSIIITAHDHCLQKDDFAAQAAAGVTVRTIKPIVDGHYRQGGKRYPIEAEVDGWQQRGTKALEILRGLADNSHDAIRIIRTVADITAAKRDGKIGIIMGFEGGRPLAGNVSNLALYQKMGLREMQLYWAVPNPLKHKDGTLTEFGTNVIREMNRLGIVVDLSHMPQRGFEQAMEIARAPIVISHCGVAAVSGGSGGTGGGTDSLSDETIRSIARNGGVIGMHFFEGYIHPRHGPHASVEDLVDHIDHIRKLVGMDYVGIGTDYFPERGYRLIEGAETIAGMPNVVREMVRRDYSDDEIQKFLGRNLMRVYREVWGQ